MLKFLRKRCDPKKELRRLIGDYELPSFPVVALQALRLLRDDRNTLSRVGKEIARDPGLTARILAATSSAAHALRRPVNDLSQAVPLLGRNRVEAMLLAVAVKQALPTTSAAGVSPDVFWSTAGRRAAVAQELAALLHPRTASATFTAVLLQDMAIPLIAHAIPDRYAPLIDRWRNGDAGLTDLENEKLGWDHAETAGWMCRAWNFPDGLTAAIATHHNDHDSTGEELPAVRLTRVLGDTEDITGVDELIATATDHYGLDRDACMAAVDAGLNRTGTWVD